MMQNMLFLIVIFAWSLPTFVFKDLTKHIGNVELMIYYHLIYHVFIFGFIIYNIVYKKNNAIEFVNSIRNIEASTERVIYIDAKITGGMSGGPLINDLGEVVGINTLIMYNIKDTQSGTIATENQPVALPIHLAREYLMNLK